MQLQHSRRNLHASFAFTGITAVEVFTLNLYKRKDDSIEARMDNGICFIRHA